MRSGIYKITNEETGKFYIGSSKDIDKRWSDHKNELRANRHCNPKLQHSWNYYGESKFSIFILEDVDPLRDKLLEREQYYLDTFRPYIRGIGYNIGRRAEGGDNITHNPHRKEFIDKMKNVCAGENNPMFGRTHSKKSVQLQKQMAKGRFTLPWFIDRYGQEIGTTKYFQRKEWLKNRKINYSHKNKRKGKKYGPLSQETKQKINESKERVKQIKQHLVYDIIDGYLSNKEISEKYSISLEAVKYHKRKIRKSL